MDRPDKPGLIGQRVTVSEPGIRSWDGTVIAEKWSRTRAAWRIEVRNDEGIMFSMPPDLIVKETLF